MGNVKELILNYLQYNMKQKIFNVLILFIIGVLWTFYLNKDNSSEIKIVHIITEKPPDFFNKPPQEGLMEALEYYEIKHPKIVYAQAILETGYFKSDLCLNNNNLFGLYNSKKQKYYTFDHWVDGIIAYKEMVQYKYKGDSSKPSDDYYNFLSDIRYAEDPDYISKVKEIVSRNDKRRSE